MNWYCCNKCGVDRSEVSAKESGMKCPRCGGMLHVEPLNDHDRHMLGVVGPSLMTAIKASRCEWDPARSEPRAGEDGCLNQAMLSVGTGKRNIHLCYSCAELPNFKRLTSRTPLRSARGI